jgi:thioredoxin reductase
LTIKKDVDIAVIGGGAAGLAAAIQARREGIEKVIIIERNEELGGILHQCIHTGFGLHYFKENLTGPEYISRFIEEIHNLNIEHMLDTMVLQILPDKKLWLLNSEEGFIELDAKAIILAMGCRERTRGNLSIPGTRPAGIFTAGTAQRLMDVDGYLPGEKIVILGSGDVGLIMARRLVMEGVKVEGVLELLSYPGGLTRNVVQCLDDFKIPLLLNHTVTKIHGLKRVKAVSISRVDDDLKIVDGTERIVECDTLILSVGLIPENELSTKIHISIDDKTGGPIVNEKMETSVQGIFACGNVVHVHDLVDYVSYSGEIAGKNAACYVLEKLPITEKRMFLQAGRNVRYIVPQIIDGEELVTIYLRIRSPERNVDINLGEAFKFYRRYVDPSEIITFKLPKIMKKEDSIIVSVKKRE